MPISSIGWICRGAAVAAGVAFSSPSWATDNPPAPSLLPPAQPPEASKPPNAPGAGAGPDVITATYGDWTLRCARKPGSSGEGKACQVMQTLALQAGGKPVAEVLFVRDPAATATVHGMLVLPHDITIAAAPKIETSDNDLAPLIFEWRRCLPVGCIAEADLTSGQATSLRSADHPGRIAFVSAAGRKLAISLPMAGFGQALDALLR
jgi:invasion protein IalB